MFNTLVTFTMFVCLSLRRKVLKTLILFCNGDKAISYPDVLLSCVLETR